MIRFLVGRLASTIPSIIGISLVAFAVLNLSMSFPTNRGMGDLRSMQDSSGQDDRSRYPDNHLPLFLNFSIADAKTYAEREIVRLNDDTQAAEAKRTLIGAGGAWLPYIIPALDKVTQKQRTHILAVLKEIGARLGLSEAVEKADDKTAFWVKYWRVYRSDFKPVRAARLVRRLIKENDELVLNEIFGLDTFCLPQLIEVLGEEMPRESLVRVVGVLVNLTGIDDPVDADASPDAVQNVVERWQDWWSKRYDRYMVVEGADRIFGFVTETRYFRWIKRSASLDFGVSSRDGRPVLAKLKERLPITLLLTTLGLLFAYLVAIPIGVISAVRHGGLFDRTMMLAVFVAYSFPTFWLAMWLIRFFAGGDYLDLFPAQGLFDPRAEGWSDWHRILDATHHLVLPVICLSSVSAAMLARYQRLGMLQVINLDFMRAAEAKGLSRTRAILRHGLRNGIIPVVTMLGLQIPYLVSGSVIVERIFGIPGMGYETFEAILAQDQPWLVAVVTVTAVMTMIGIVVADAVYAAIDPRIAPGIGGLRR
jgi:peptide/nickel transport system permease protein